MKTRLVLVALASSMLLSAPSFAQPTIPGTTGTQQHHHKHKGKGHHAKAGSNSSSSTQGSGIGGTGASN